MTWEFDRQETMILAAIAINTILGLLYMLWGCFLLGFIRKKRNSEKTTRKFMHFFRAMIIIASPIVGISFFGFGYLWQKIFFRRDVDLTAVIFSKEHVETQMKADEERGRNLAPVEEALAVSDKDSLRMLMMNVIRGDIRKSLAAISLALNSEDSETAHYAASVLRDELNGFRMQVQRIIKEIKNEEENQVSLCIMLLEYMNGVLAQGVFSELEQLTFVRQMEEVIQILYDKDSTKVESRHFEWICMRLMECKEFELMQKWCDRQMREFPDELPSYVCMLKLYYSIMNRERFFEVLNNLKKSNIVLDNATLDLMRLFG
ncbi:MAG: hypothetical protein LBM69_10130 [Lachnospiraceae bacterium]|jgi:hypothetical protein|nr:hypothetical protein [Lachnospiraceae bacterium]